MPRNTAGDSLDHRDRALTRVARGVLIGLWGAVVYLPTLSLFAEAWPVWANCVIWSVVYSRTPPTLRLGVIQAVATVVAAVGGTLWRDGNAYSLLAAAPGLFYFVAWMAPVAVIASFRKDGRESGAAPTDSVPNPPSGSRPSDR